MLGQTGSQKNGNKIQPVATVASVTFQVPSSFPAEYSSGGFAEVVVVRYYGDLCPQGGECTAMGYNFCPYMLTSGIGPCLQGGGLISNSQFQGDLGSSWRSKNILTLDVDTSSTPGFTNVLCQGASFGNPCIDPVAAPGGLIQVSFQQTPTSDDLGTNLYVSAHNGKLYTNEQITNTFSANVSGTVLIVPITQTVDYGFTSLTFQGVIPRQYPQSAAITAAKLALKPSELAKRQGQPEAVVRLLQRMENELQRREALQK
jgi:hypothetical protein